MSETDAEERELKMAQIRADIANKEADTAYKNSARTTEPIKAIAAIVASVATVVAGVFGALGYILGRGH